MIALSTGNPSATVDALRDRIVVSFPSGDGQVQIDMSLHEAMFLATTVRRAAIEGFDGFASAAHSAQVIAFPQPAESQRKGARS